MAKELADSWPDWAGLGKPSPAVPEMALLLCWVVCACTIHTQFSGSCTYSSQCRETSPVTSPE